MNKYYYINHTNLCNNLYRELIFHPSRKRRNNIIKTTYETLKIEKKKFTKQQRKRPKRKKIYIKIT